MNNLIDYIKNNTNGLYKDIKIVSVVYNKEVNTIEVKVVYKSDFDFNLELRENLIKIIKNFIEIKNVKIDLKTKKSLLDEGAIYQLIAYFMQKNYASIYATINKKDVLINLNNELVKVTIKVNNAFYSYLENKGFSNELKEFLERNYFQNFECELEEIFNDDNFENQLDEHAKLFEDAIISDYNGPEIKYLIVSNIETFLGGKIETEKVPTLNFITAAGAGVTAAGEINFITKRSFTSKRKNANGEFEEREFYNFTLNDGYGKLQCVYFPSKEAITKFDELQNNTQVLVFGDVEEYNGRLSLKVKSISTCSIPKKEEEHVKQKFENDRYLFVKPEPYVSMMQSNLFDVVIECSLPVLLNNDFVVFDLETTGLDASSNEIIEIGACKVQKGKITETFSCLVKPKELIPDEITKLTGITNEMVSGCYNIEQVLQDFYKFTRNCVLVAYNIAFDYKFIYVAGSAQGYIFDNKQIDCMVLARNKLKGLKNYKLKTVVEKLNISLEGAHRAVNDATATAEAFIKLSDDNMM